MNRDVIGLGGLAAGCAMLGALATLVEAVSLTFAISTIERRQRHFVTPQPQKRPRSSFVRF